MPYPRPEQIRNSMWTTTGISKFLYASRPKLSYKVTQISFPRYEHFNTRSLLQDLHSSIGTHIPMFWLGNLLGNLISMQTLQVVYLLSFAWGGPI